VAALSVSVFWGCQKDSQNVIVKDTKVSNFNSVSIDEAKIVYQRYLQQTKTSSTLKVRSGEESNSNDLIPNWNATSNFNYLDTLGNFLSVPTEAYLGRGYKKIIFLRLKGEVTLLVANLLPDYEYLIKRKGFCTMNDFSGYLYFKNNNNINTGGFKFKDGKITDLLIPNTNPINGFDDDPESDNILNTFVVTAPRQNGGGSSFAVFNAVLFSNYPTFSNNTFTLNGFGTTAVGVNNTSSDPDNSAYDGLGNVIIDAEHHLCAATIEFKDGKNDATIKTTGFSNFTVSWTFTDNKGKDATQKADFGNMWIEVSANSLYPASMTVIAWENAYANIQTKLNGSFGNIDVKGQFYIEFVKELAKSVITYATGHNSNPVYGVVMTSDKDKYSNQYGTVFKQPTTCQ
jgi:hypothetical protein